MVNTMVPAAVLPVQLVPVYQVAVPEVPEVAVNRAPVVTPLLLPSSSAAVMALAARAHWPAVNVQGEEVITSLAAEPGTTDSSWVPLLKVPEAMVTVGVPARLSS